MNVEQQLKEFGFDNNSKTKKEQIEKLNCIINNLKEELEKNNIEKCKEKEINDIKKEIGVIEVIDIDKILPSKTKKFMQSYLEISKDEVQINIIGKVHSSYQNRNNRSELNKNEINGKELKSVKIMKNIGKQNQKVYSSYGINKKNNNNNINVKKIIIIILIK